MDILTLIDKRNNLMDEAEKFLTEKTTENGGLSEDDAKTYDEMEKNIDAVTKNIERFQRQNARNSADGSFTRAPIRPELSGNTNTKFGRASDEYKKAALDALRSNFRQVANILQEQNNPDGGYLVPTEWENRLMEMLHEENVMRTLATSIKTSTEHKVPFPTQGATAYLVAEGAPITASQAAFGQKTLNAYKLAVQTIVSNELIFDSAFDIEDFILSDFARALAIKEEDLFINGTGETVPGTSQPTGFLTTAETNSETMITTTAGANLTSDDIIKFVYDLPRQYRPKAAFLMNDATLATIRRLKDNNQRYIWDDNYQAGEPGRLLGYPVFTSPCMPTIAAGKNVLAFGDFSYYKIADRGEKTFQRLNELYASTFSTGYVMTARVDGLLLDDNALRVLKIKP